MTQAIEVQDLRKYYGATKAVDGVSFTVEQGEVFAMLGPNGAGKTTTTEIVEGLREPDAGVANVLGLNVHTHKDEVQDRIGVQLQTTAMYPRLNVREVLELFRAFFPGETHSSNKLIGMMNLEEKAGTLTKDLSGGQRQRLSVALALVNKPEVIFLDEPTTGLDPQARRNMWQIIRQIQDTGTTVFLTTHYMEEAETLCDRVAVMDKGKIIAQNTPRGLVSEHFEETAIEFEDSLEMPEEGTFSGLPAVTRTRRENHHVTLYTTDATATLGGLTELSNAGTIRFDGLNVRRPTLEDVFLKLTGKRIRE